MSTHAPVMGAEVADALDLKADGIYADCTFGRGGYARIWLERTCCRVFGIDRDPEAIEAANAMARAYDGRLIPVQGRFGDIADLMRARDAGPLDGLAMDLGVSSPQLDQAGRGFSFMRDGPLDMRMGDSGETAADIVNGWEADRLADLFYHYGEERRSRRIARAIGEERTDNPFETTLHLASVVARAAPSGNSRIHPATRVFQALRIAVNDELGELHRGLSGAEQVLAAGGRLAVVSFHSLEDRIVKQFLSRRSGAEPQGSRHRPETQAAHAPSFRLIKRGAIKPTKAEVDRNPRARSAKLRVAERLDTAPWPYQASDLGWAA
ncbi:16S rRNA (cytosine(1402)-N(4))-methyltransferase RsmH [Minwuia sp.]|uniref:16S rRNA (cytosine(1402)-N(4))-methyltransferase RsmH n=1 Tax=Minwuia sp. TaxID=2493630 RepID=UPI003A91558F